MNRDVKKKVKIRLIEKDMNQRALANKLQVSEAMISLMFSPKNEKTSRRLEVAIAEILEMDPKELWG